MTKSESRSLMEREGETMIYRMLICALRAVCSFFYKVGDKAGETAEKVATAIEKKEYAAVEKIVPEGMTLTKLNNTFYVVFPADTTMQDEDRFPDKYDWWCGTERLFLASPISARTASWVSAEEFSKADGNNYFASRYVEAKRRLVSSGYFS